MSDCSSWSESWRNHFVAVYRSNRQAEMLDHGLDMFPDHSSQDLLSSNFIKCNEEKNENLLLFSDTIYFIWFFRARQRRAVLRGLGNCKGVGASHAGKLQQDWISLLFSLTFSLFAKRFIEKEGAIYEASCNGTYIGLFSSLAGLSSLCLFIANMATNWMTLTRLLLHCPKLKKVLQADMAENSTVLICVAWWPIYFPCY